MFFACHTNYDKVWLRPGVVLDLLYTASEGGDLQHSLNPPRNGIPPVHERTNVLFAITYPLDGVTGTCGSHAPTLSPFIRGW